MTETIAAPAPAAVAAAAPVAPAPAATSVPAAETLLGTPKPEAHAAPADFKLTAPKDSGFDDKYVGEVAKWAADAKLAPEAAQAVLDRDHARASAEAKFAAESKDKALTALKSAYTPDTLHEMDVAVTGFVRTHFGDEIAKWLQDTGVIFDRRIFDSFAKLAKAGREAPMTAAVQPTAQRAMSVGRREFPNTPSMWTAEERAAEGK